MTKGQNDYFGWNWVLSLILAIFPLTGLILGIVVRCSEKKWLAAVIRLLLGWNILWICDIICMIVQRRIIRILNI